MRSRTQTNSKFPYYTIGLAGLELAGLYLRNMNAPSTDQKMEMTKGLDQCPFFFWEAGFFPTADGLELDIFPVNFALPTQSEFKIGEQFCRVCFLAAMGTNHLVIGTELGQLCHLQRVM